MKRILLPLLCISAHALAAGPQPAAIKAESIVRFPKSTIACLSKTGLHDVLTYSVRGEDTKANALMIGSGDPDAECIMLDPRKRYKVISVEYNDPAQPEMGLLEVVGEGVTRMHGAWTLSIVAQLAK